MVFDPRTLIQAVIHLTCMPSYSDEDLLEEIRRVADVVDAAGAPTVTQFNEHSSIADSTIHRRFGSWNAGVAKAGFDPNPPEPEIPTEDLIDELHRVRDEAGHIPTSTQINAEGDYSRSTYQKRFGSWRDALVAAFDDIEGVDDIDPRRSGDPNLKPPSNPSGRPQEHTDDALIAELHRIAAEHRDPPRIRDVREHSEYGAQTYIRRFGSWRAALEEAGFEPEWSTRVSTDELLADLHRLRDELGTRPTATDVVEEGAHGIATYQRRFGSWSAAVEAAFGDEDAADPHE
ncbi:hypothetical protein U4E84_09905 [Halorubrum sp. AD140]|uniref:homing endonuclease associated repeat-containing protein n=1 Tax=Halorubrum sp. AD140 TaxID=3050073 RepID=UPI002ACC4DBB|nr:hypothetical protein [Halorubrum sp. AD140]MDZ5811655.1 hypothetical protein [Halorubrum sp. AD140]